MAPLKDRSIRRQLNLRNRLHQGALNRRLAKVTRFGDGQGVNESSKAARLIMMPEGGVVLPIYFLDRDSSGQSRRPPWPRLAVAVARHYHRGKTPKVRVAQLAMGVGHQWLWLWLWL